MNKFKRNSDYSKRKIRTQTFDENKFITDQFKNLKGYSHNYY